MPINDRVVALWSLEAKQETQHFLGSLAPNYFLVASRALAQVNQGREERLAATNIRMMRDQAAEMLFSLLAAAIQSPRGVILWLLAYRTDELDAVIGGFGGNAAIRTNTGTRASGSCTPYAQLDLDTRSPVCAKASRAASGTCLQRPLRWTRKGNMESTCRRLSF